MTGVALRAFEPDDVPAVAAIEAAVSPDPWSPGLFLGEFTMSASERHWLVAEVGERPEIAGFGGMMFAGGEGHLMNVAVHPSHRRLGIGRRLCLALFDDARRRGIDAITLEVRSSNATARELYRSLGFVPVGARKDYYRTPDGGREDALILWLHDVRSRSFDGAAS